jgi:transposase
MPQDLRAVLRLAGGRSPDPTAAIFDSRTLRSTPESGTRAGYDGAKRKRGSKVHMAVDTLGHLLALHVTPADIGDRAAVGRLCADIQDATGEHVQLAYVDQGYTGETAADAAAAEGITLHVHQGQIRDDQRPLLVADVRRVRLAKRTGTHPFPLSPRLAKVHNTL